MSKVAILMGSASDVQIMAPAEQVLKSFKIPYERKIVSAHRNPDEAAGFSKNAKGRGIDVIIAGAGKAAHLPGVIAAQTTVPVIGVPISSGPLSGLDALFAIVQMPSGVPVATVGINESKNAALLAVQILALKDKNLSSAFSNYKKELSAPKPVKETSEAERPIIDG